MDSIDERRLNNNDNSKTTFMVLWSWQSHCEISFGSFDECRTAPCGCQPKTKPDDLIIKAVKCPPVQCTGCQSLHPPSPFIIITQPESWYSFYRPTEGRRLSRPSWLYYIPIWCTRPQTVTHPGTNRVWRSATTLIEANALPLSQTVNQPFVICFVGVPIHRAELVCNIFKRLTLL